MRTEPPPSNTDDANDPAVGSRQLKVEDALAYLEQVKSQFADCPKVYNNFLDIMKEFKAQTIDTGEVIKRVSTLFQGHSKLILGFNTFLPPGFRIELRGDPATGCVTGFSSPGGVFMPLNSNDSATKGDQQGGIAQQMAPPPPPPQQMPISGAHHMPGHHPSAPMPPHQMQSMAPEGMVPPPMLAAPDRVYDRDAVYQNPPKAMADADPKVSAVDATGMPHHQALRHPAAPGTQKFDQRMKPPVPNDNAAAALRGFSDPMQPATTGQGKPIEFEQAVTYVNKIKSRFAEDEAVYKDFLNILQTYQKDQKDITEVNRQVSILFRDHEDLLAEFSRFLPEQSLPYVRQPPYHNVQPDHSQSRARSSQTVVKQQPVLESAADVKPAPYASSSTWKGKDKPPKAASGSSRAKAAKQTLSAAPTAGPSSRQGARGRHSGGKKGRRRETAGKRAAAVESKSAQAHAAQSGAPAQHAGSAATPELEFFEELRGLLGPQGQRNYSEFIKCLSLFSQEIISGEELMRLADGLLGNRKPLTDAFCAFIDQTDPNSTQTAVQILRRAKASATSAGTSGSEEKGSAPPSVNAAVVRERIKDLPSFGNLPPTSASVGSRSPKINPKYKGKSLSDIAKSHGKPVADNDFYMTLPADLSSMHCSGRTENDQSVLNDSYVLKGDTSGRSLIDDGLRNAGLARFGRLSIHAQPGSRGSKPPLPPTRAVAAADALSSPRTVQSPPPSAPMCIEDQRLEIELMIERAKSTIQKLDKLESGELQSSDICPVDVKPIEMIYTDMAVDVVEVLRINPMRTAGVIASRLRQRVKEWMESRANLEKIWKSKRFSRRDPMSDIPRNWKRPELVRDVVDDGRRRGEGSSGRKKLVSVDLVCEDKNLSVMCDILWFGFEWEASDVEEADKALEVIEQLYHVVQEACTLSRKMYVDDYLYAYMRLIAEASTRVQFVLGATKEEGQLERYVDCVKDVLGGDCSSLEYEEFCEKMFGGEEKWEEYLCDLPLILKRLTECSLKLPRRQPALDLLEMARAGVKKALEDRERKDGQAESERNEAGAGELWCSASKMEIVQEGDDAVERTGEAQGDESEAMEDSDGRRHESGGMVGHESAEGKVFEEVEKARRMVNEASGYLFEVQVRRYTEGRDEGRRKTLKVTFRHIKRSDACQFRQLKMGEDAEVGKPVVSTLTRYLKRAKKRKLQHDMVHGVCGGGDRDMEVYEVNALDVRVDERGGLMYVQGTEDFFMNGKFKRRKTGGERRHGVGEAKRAVAIEV